MIDLLFDRRSKVVLGVILASFYMGYLNMTAAASGWVTVLLGLSTSFYGFTAFCRFFPWYSAVDRGHGIEEHFIKTFIAAAYAYAISSLAFQISGWGLFIGIGSLLLIAPAGTNALVLLYHFQDKLTVAPGYYSRSLYEKPPTPPSPQ